MSYVTFTTAADLASGAGLSARSAAPTRRGQAPAFAGVSLVGGLQVGLLIATLSCVSFVLSIVAAGAF